MAAGTCLLGVLAMRWLLAGGRDVCHPALALIAPAAPAGGGPLQRAVQLDARAHPGRRAGPRLVCGGRDCGHGCVQWLATGLHMRPARLLECLPGRRAAHVRCWGSTHHCCTSPVRAAHLCLAVQHPVLCCAADPNCPGLAPEVSLYTFRVFTNDQVGGSICFVKLPCLQVLFLGWGLFLFGGGRLGRNTGLPPGRQLRGVRRTEQPQGATAAPPPVALPTLTSAPPPWRPPLLPLLLCPRSPTPSGSWTPSTTPWP